jgi:hypothetical protein
VELSETVYALDSTAIDLRLSVFPWAPFRATKAAVKMHTLLDLRGAIPSFIHVSDGKLHDCRSTLCYRFCRSRSSRKSHYIKPLPESSTNPTMTSSATN